MRPLRMPAVAAVCCNVIFMLWRQACVVCYVTAPPSTIVNPSYNLSIPNIEDGANLQPSCYRGAYKVALPPFGPCAGYRSCEPGNYCNDGIKQLCPPGTYGEVGGLFNATCSGLCAPGYYCPEGSISRAQNNCGDATVYCPLGSSQPILVPSGYFSIGEGWDESVMNQAKRSAIVLCPPGYFCQQGFRIGCPGGTYGNTSGLTDETCSGPCPAGFFCPVASTDALLHPCTASPNQYCPIGSAVPLPTAEGYYAVDFQGEVATEGGFAAQARCPLGTYCDQGLKFLCAAGRYGSRTGEWNTSCSGICQRGWYCPLGSIANAQVPCGDADVYCPEGSGAPTQVSRGHFTIGSNANWSVLATGVDATGSQFQQLLRVGQAICSPGHYCLADGIPRECRPGRYGSSQGLTTPECDGPCDGGYYCPSASISARQIPCGGAHLFCPFGSSVPQEVNAGYYTTGGDSIETQTQEKKCHPGSWCALGIRKLCDAGHYGETFGLTDPTCTGLCSPGYYCPQGSIVGTEVKCGDAVRYCPRGSPAPLKVTVGYFSTDEFGSVATTEATRSKIALTPKGFFSIDGLLYKCPAGFYGATTGLSSEQCSGRCDVPGFYCPAGSTSPNMRSCGNDSYICPQSTVAPIHVHSGFYTADYLYEDCPPGQYRDWTESWKDPLLSESSTVVTSLKRPLCTLCPAGTHKSVTGDSKSMCLPCLASKGLSDTPDRRLCKCNEIYEVDHNPSSPIPLTFIGHFDPVRRVCIKTATTDVPYLDESYWPMNTSMTRSVQFVCPIGHFCVDGIRYKCPAGYFGGREQETNPTCQGLCEPGYYCPAGSVSQFSVPCGNPGVICPLGSSQPSPVPAGYYSNEDALTYLRSSMLPCPVGWYCPASTESQYGTGLRYICPAGTYGSAKGLSDPQCMGYCDTGYYCLQGSSSPQQFACGNATVYCPRGSPGPRLVKAGFYTAFSGLDGGKKKFWDTGNTTSSVEIPCEPGYYCIGGVKYPCPPGTFGWRSGMTSSTCGGLCAEGHYCPSYLTPQSGAPGHTKWPGKPHTNAADFECGGGLADNANFYCPKGSYFPIPVTGGYYTIGGNSNNNTRSAQVICPPGHYCTGGIPYECPQGKYGQESGLSTPECTAWCPPGYYCPSGSPAPIKCGPTSFAIGAAIICSICPGGRTKPLECQNSLACCYRAS